MISRTVKALALAGASAILSGCTSLYQFGDPREKVVGEPGAPVQDVIKSIRCETILFLQNNRLRHKVFNQFYFRDKTTPVPDRYRFLNLQDARAAGIYANLKIVETVDVNGAVDRKVPLSSDSSLTPHLGVGLVNTRTYEMNQTYVLPQDSQLFGAPPGDGFFCYNYVPPKLGDVAKLAGEHADYLEYLLRNNIPSVQQFRRIYMNGNLTLAAWLQDVGAEMSLNYLTKVEQNEAIYPGQLAYTFTLDVKPSADAKLSYIATLTNPLTAGLSGSATKTNEFSIALNTYYSEIAAGAKNGQAVLTPRGAEPQPPKLGGVPLHGPRYSVPALPVSPAPALRSTTPPALR